MTAGNSFIFDTLKYIPIKVLPAFSGILSIFFLTKKGLLDTDNYLDYTFIIATLLIIGQIVGGWVNSSVIYYYTGFNTERERNDFVLNISLLQMLFIAVGAISVFATILFAVKSAAVALLSVFILALQSYLTFNYSFFQAQRQIANQTFATLVQALFQIGGLLACYFFFKGSITIFFFFLLLSYFATTIFLFVTGKNVMSVTFTNKLDYKSFRQILNYGMPICLWFFLTQIYQVGDRILFKYFDLTVHVGNYVAFRDFAVGLSGFIAMPLLFASHPIIIMMSKDKSNKAAVEGMLRKNIFILTAIFIPLIVITYFYGEKIIGLLVGENYLLSPVLMVVVLFTILLGVISIYLQKGVEAVGNTMLMLKISAIVATVSITLNFVLMRRFGVNASIFVSLFCHILYCLVIYIYSRKVFRIFF